MPSIFSKNCVVSGTLDSYCLVCSQHLQTQEETLAHIQATQHRRNLHSTAYFDKYKQDYIKKVKDIYFCEVCNMTFATATKVGLHVTEEAHLINKRYNCIRRVNDHIVFHDNTAVTEAAWNGLVEDTCVLCNEDIDGDSTHKTDKKHLLNLITSKVSFGSDGYVYREIDDICHCLSCNKVVLGKEIASHFNTAEHKSCYLTNIHLVDSPKAFDVVNEQNPKIEKLVKYEKDEKTTIIEGAPGHKETALKESDQSKNNDKEMSHAKLAKDPDSPIVPKDVATFAKEHGLSVKDGGRVYCDECRTDVPATLARVKQHVSESKHKDKMTTQSTSHTKDTKKIKKMPLKKFKKEVAMFEDTGIPALGLWAMNIIINNKFCVNYFYFEGVASFNNKIICRLCDIDLPVLDKVVEHVSSSTHEYKMSNISIITLFDKEFIREIKPDLYDCCYCKEQFDWDDLLHHLTTPGHKKIRQDHERILQKFQMIFNSAGIRIK